MGVTVRRRTNLGRVKDLDFLAFAEPVLEKAFEEIVQGIEENLSGGMIHARDSGGAPSTRPKVGTWYEASIEEGPRSRTIHVEVADGVPSILHTGSPNSWEIKPVNKKSLHWLDDTGEDVFVKRVTHPPMEPRPFAQEPVERVAAKIPGRIRAVIRRRLQGKGK